MVAVPPVKILVQDSTMALSLSQTLLCIHSPKTNPLSNSQTIIRTNPIGSVRLRLRLPTPPKSSPQKNSPTSQQPQLKITPENDQSPPHDPPPDQSSLLDSFSIPLRRLRSDLPFLFSKFFQYLTVLLILYIYIFCGSEGIFRFDGLVPEIMSIALPAALSLAADPIASLVDTAFVGHIGI